MPFAKWSVEPVFMCRQALPPDKNEPGNFYPATNASLVSCLRQLASVAKIADRVFEEIGCECRLLSDRTDRLKDKIGACQEVVSKLNARALKIHVPDLCETVRRAASEPSFQSQREQTTQLFLPSTRPPCVDLLYEGAGQNPVAVLCTMDRFRTDGLSASRLFMVTPVLGAERRKKRGVLDIETRKPANFSLVRPCQDRPECGSSSLPVSPSSGFFLKQTDRQLELERLPSPEEQAVLLSLEYPSAVVPVDTSGTGFTRMSLLRRSLMHADFIIKRRKSKKRSKRRHTICEGESRTLAHSSCQTDDLPSPAARTALAPRRRSRSVQDTRPGRSEDSLRMTDSAKDSATEDDKSPTKSATATIKKSKSSSLRSRASLFNPLPHLSAALAAVKMRHSSSRGRHGKGDDGRSSSGNWSASSSTRASVDSSDHTRPDGPSSPSRNSIGRDSLLSDATTAQHDRSRDDVLAIQSLTSSPVKKKRFNHPGLDPSSRNRTSSSNSTTPTPDFTSSVGSAGTPLVRSPYASRRCGVSDDGDSSVYSVDTDGYYTSMHTDSGLWTNPLSTLKSEEDVPGGFRERKESQSSVSTLDNSSINSFLSKSATECSSNSGSFRSSHRDDTSERPDATSTDVSVAKDAPEQTTDTSDKSYSPHPPNGGSASESEHEVGDRIRVKTSISSHLYPSMCAVSPETSDDEIADLRRRTMIPNVNVVFAEVHSDRTKEARRTEKPSVPKPPNPRSSSLVHSVNMYRSETPVPSTFSSSVLNGQPLRTSTPRSGANITTFLPDCSSIVSTNVKTSTPPFRISPSVSEANSDDVTKMSSSPQSKVDKSLIPLKYAQRITVTPIARSDVPSLQTGRTVPTPLAIRTESPSATLRSDQPSSPSYVSYKAPDSPVTTSGTFRTTNAELKVSSPTNSLTRSVARVTLDPTGKVVYSSNSLERSFSQGSSSEKSSYATLPKCQINASNCSTPVVSASEARFQTSQSPLTVSGKNQPHIGEDSRTPLTNVSDGRGSTRNHFAPIASSGKDFSFRPSRGGRFCRSYFPSHLLSASSQTARANQPPSSLTPPNSSPTLSGISATSYGGTHPRTTCTTSDHSAGRNDSKTDSLSRSLQTTRRESQLCSSTSPLNSVPKPDNPVRNTMFVNPPVTASIWPNRPHSSVVNNTYVFSSPKTSQVSQLETSSVTPKCRPLSSSLSPPDLIPSGESPPSTLDITSLPLNHLDRKRSPDVPDVSPETSTNKNNLKSLSANELFAIIHNSKKRHNIKSESELSMSPLSSRSVSPALSQSSLSKLQPAETGVLSRRSDSPGDRSRWSNSLPSARKSPGQEKLGSSKPTSMRDFKMLLLQARTGDSSSPRPSAAELLKVSPPKSSPTSPSKPMASTPTKSPLPVSYSSSPSSGHPTVPLKRNFRTRSPYLSRYDSAYPPILEEMESHEENTKCGLQQSPPGQKATSTWV